MRGVAAGGLATVAVAPGGMAGGVARAFVFTASAGAAVGTVTVDNARMNAWGIPPGDAWLERGTRAVALIDGDDFTDYLTSPVTTDESVDAIARTAQFDISHPRVAYFHPQTISGDAKPVDIRIWVGPPGDKHEWKCFRGTVTAAPNDDPLLPHAQFTAVSLLATALGQPLCYSLPPLSLRRRWDVAKEVCALYGVTLVSPSSGHVLRKPQDYGGLTLGQLILRFCELEDCYAVETDDGDLEIKPASVFLTGPAKFAFSIDDGISSPAPREEPPNAPITDVVIVGARLSDASLSAPSWTTRVDGSPTAGVVIRTTTFGEAIVNQVVEEWGNVPLDGVAPSPPGLRMTRRTTVANVYDTHTGAASDGRLSTALLTRTTTVEELAGTPVWTGFGGAHTWAPPNGGTYAEAFAVFMVTSQSSELFVYDGCLLSQSQKRTSTLYAPLGYGGSMFLYSDNSLRTAGFFSLIETSVENIRYATSDDSREVVTNTGRYVSTGTINLSGTIYPVETFVGTDIFGGIFTPGTFADTKSESWRLSGAAVVHVTSYSSVDPKVTPQPAAFEYLPAPLPDLPRGSADEPIYSQIPFSVAVRLGGLVNYRTKVQIEDGTAADSLSTFVEDEDEAERVAWRLLREALSDTYQQEGLMVPTLRPADPVTVSDLVRSVDGARAYVSSIQRVAGGPNGENGQVNRLKIWPTYTLSGTS